MRSYKFDVRCIRNLIKKAIILAGGTGSRLSPLTIPISKQLLPLYDKPMIYYPLSLLMNIDVREFLIITTPQDRVLFEKLLKDGNEWGISINYAVQKKPEGIAQALIIGSDFIDKSPFILALGDNFFHGNSFIEAFRKASILNSGATIFAYPVNDPQRYGVVEFDKNGNAINIEEKPKNPKTNFAVTGIYFYDRTAVDKALTLRPSSRGELEISSLNNIYMSEGKLRVELVSKGSAWLDTGTTDSLLEASSYIKTLEKRQGLKIGCPEEVAWEKGWIDNTQLKSLAKVLGNSGYGDYLSNLIC